MLLVLPIVLATLLFIRIILSLILNSSRFTSSLFNFSPTTTIHRAKVIFVLQSVAIGGLERMVFNLARGLKASGGPEPLLFVYEHGEEGDYLLSQFEKEGIKTITLRKKSGFSLFVVIKLMITLIRYRVSLIHTHHLGALIYASLARISLLFIPKLIHTHHSFIHLNYENRYRSFEKIFSRFTNHLVAVSDEVVQTYQSFGFNATLIENGIDFSKRLVHSQLERQLARTMVIERAVIEESSENARAKLLTQREKLWILYLARIFPQKGQDGAIEIWSKLSETVRSKALLVFVGPSSDKREAQRIQQLAQRIPSIVFAGPTSEPENWINASDIFLSCSESEGLPLAPLEAIGSGVPALLSDIDGHRAILGYRAIVPYASSYELKNSEDGAKKLTHLIDNVSINPISVKKSTWETTHELRKSFGIERMIKKYQEIYGLYNRGS